MIKLTRINGIEFLLNHDLITIIEAIPETKVVLQNKEYYIVQESFDEIIDKIVEFNAKIIDKGAYLAEQKLLCQQERSEEI
ncbi:MAG: flagellar FlbD family protein [Eubacteriales bacterium]